MNMTAYSSFTLTESFEEPLINYFVTALRTSYVETRHGSQGMAIVLAKSHNAVSA